MELTERLGDSSLRVRLLNSYSSARFAAGAVDEALALRRESLRLADRSGGSFLRFLARSSLAAVLTTTGPLGEALVLSQEAEALGEGAPELDVEVGADPFGFLLATQARTLTYLGRLGEVARAAERVFDIARARGDTEILGVAHNSSATLSAMLGDGVRAVRHARESVRIAEASGVGFARTSALGALGSALLANGEWSEAADVLTAVLALMREQRTVAEALTLAMLAEAHLGAGDPARAREAIDLACDVARLRPVPVFDIRVLLARARVLLAIDGARGVSEIEVVLRDATALVISTEAHAYLPFIHQERAELARLGRDEATRQRELREAHRLFTAMGATARAEQVARELDA
jgi:ATP/maltotriose-dependent transcriptional regulator MalT